MGWAQCNTTLEDEVIHESALFDGHDFTFHRLGLFLSAIFSVIAVAVSFFLMFMHTIHYSKPNEQRHIIRILFMVPVYAAVSFLSYLYYNHSVYFEVLRDCYEAFAIASFFSLLCAYIADDLHLQKEYFRTIKPRRWVWPMPWIQKCCGGEHGIWRTPRSGLTWFNVIWVAIFQYCFIRVAMTVVAVITQYFDRYCLESLSPAFSHIWVMVIEAMAVTIAMYCLIQFYIQVRMDIQQHKPLLKVLAIKLVIFLSFWQSLLISFLTSSGAIKASDRIQTPDIKIGIPAMLLCIEMAIFAVFHLWAFSWRPYVIGSKAYRAATDQSKAAQTTSYSGGPLGVKAIFNAFNPWDLIKAIGRAAKWLFRDRKHRLKDASYATTLNTNLDQAQKMNNLSAPTGYAGAGARPEQEEGQTLLSAAQPMPVYRPPSPTSNLHDPSPWGRVETQEYGQTLQPQAGDIGVSQTEYGQDWRSHGQPPPQPQHHNFSRPVQSGRAQQQTRITGATVPYPISRQDAGQTQQDRGEQSRISMPYFPPPPKNA